MSILALKNISKEFPGVKALDNVSLNAYKGEAMALLGENGAGKSTLIKIIGGAYKKDSGEIYIHDKLADISSVNDAKKNKIAVIHQELNLIPNMSIAENIYLGREPKTSLGMIDKKKMNDDADFYLKKLGIDIDTKLPVKRLSIASQQMVEIAKALSMDAEIIIMDEPTDALTDKEVDKLFEIIKELKQQDKAIIYISHRLIEIFEICEKVTVLRDGQLIAETSVADIDEDKLINMMVGRNIDEQFPYIPKQTDENILTVENLTNEHIKDVSFTLDKGEILGISGLVGAGRTELAKTLYGFYKKDSGRVILAGNEINPKSPKDALALGISYVSEDRKKDGLVLIMNVKHNITLSALEKMSSPFMIDYSKENDIAQHYKDKMNIKTPNLNQKIKNLSGGNQQKVSIAKGLVKEPEILILDEPTRGVDVGAKFEIYELINKLKSEGKAIIMISSEMPELLGMSDRILVMHEGIVKGELQRDQASQESIMKLILS